ncbi:MAG: RICIN domain-containing protein [Eubacterium sp.]|nr:RICIN domain-containing protein [Eubacterium sp.]
MGNRVVKRILAAVTIFVLSVTSVAFPQTMPGNNADAPKKAKAAGESYSFKSNVDYYIWLEQDMNYRWNINNTGLCKGECVQLDYPAGTNCSMRFTSVDDMAGYYAINFSKSSYYIDANATKYETGQVLHQYHTKVKQDNQYFMFEKVDDDAYIAKVNLKDKDGNYLYVGLEKSAAQYTKLCTVDKGNATRWVIQEKPTLQAGVKIPGTKSNGIKKPQDGAPTFELFPKGFVRAVNVHNDAVVVGDSLQLFHIGTSAKVTAEWVESEKSYKLRNYMNEEESTCCTDASEFVWDVDGQGLNPGRTLHVWYNGADSKKSQLWRFVEADKKAGTYYIQNVNSGLYVSTERKTDADGEKLIQDAYPMEWELHMVSTNYAVRDANTGTINPNNWMKTIPEDTPLSAVNMPGTHDAGAAAFDFNNINRATRDSALAALAQGMFLDEQLNSGIRVWDIRINKTESIFDDVLGINNPSIVHGFSFEVCQNKNNSALRLKEVMDIATNFLDDNQTETVVMLLGADGKIGGDDFALGCVRDLQKKYDWPIYVPSDVNQVPTVGDVRGKIVLITRISGLSDFDSDYRNMFGPDASGWTCQKDLYHIPNSNVYCQDKYDEDSATNKISYFKNAATTAASGELTQSNYVFNYTAARDAISQSRAIDLSLVNDSDLGRPTSVDNRKRFGFIMTNYIDPVFARKLYLTNFDSNNYAMFKENTLLKMSTPKINKTKVKKDDITVKWKKAEPYVTGFNVQISKNKNFKKFQGFHVKKGTLKEKKIKNVKPGTYYIRLQAIAEKDGIKYTSKWSKTKKVVVKG